MTAISSLATSKWRRALGPDGIALTVAMASGGASLTVAANMRRAGGLRQRFRGAFLDQVLDRGPFGAHAAQVELGGPGPRDHDEVDPRWNEARPLTETLAANAFDSIPADGVAHASPDDEPEP
jgi:cytochrome c5